jgi:putative phosphoesterase
VTKRVGVVADTHCPEFLDRLPEGLFDALAGVEMVLHAGDITALETLRDLERIAPVYAVRGDHDSSLADVASTAELEVAGKRVVVVHGNRNRLIEEPVTFVGTVSLGHYWPRPGLHRHLKKRFPSADVVVYGHTHAAANESVEGTLMFNPGAVYQVTRDEADRRLRSQPNWFEWSWLQVIRRRRRTLRSSVGILEFTDDAVKGTIVEL